MTSLGIIAIGGVGIMMLSGRVPVRRAGLAIMGLFVAFGATAIANGLAQAIFDPVSSEQRPPAVDQPPLALPQRPVDKAPYAGAALPDR